jgi:hypothetical protein
MIISLFGELLDVRGVSMAINYGLNKVREGPGDVIDVGRGGDDDLERCAASVADQVVPAACLPAVDRRRNPSSGGCIRRPMGDPPGPTIPPYAAHRRFARRLPVHSGR